MRALLIIPKFFSYEQYIKKEIQTLGYDVDMIFENPNEFSIVSKFKLKLVKNKDIYFNKYYCDKIKNNNFDLVLAIRASSLSKLVIEFIKKESPNVKLYMYQWDSIKNNPNALSISEEFDEVSTFDVEDSKKYGWKYRPLFYIKSNDRIKKRKYDVAFIATLHSQRVRLYKKIKSCKYKSFLYIYSKFSHFVKEKYILP